MLESRNVILHSLTALGPQKQRLCNGSKVKRSYRLDSLPCTINLHPPQMISMQQVTIAPIRDLNEHLLQALLLDVQGVIDSHDMSIYQLRYFAAHLSQ